MHIHPLITDSATLANLCTRLADADFVTVDTEFMRESTYYPELCLIQIADVNEAAAIDPMAPGLDLTPLLTLLTDNDDVLKVVHAGGQDIEIIYNLTGKTPHPLFDTQVAAMALGQGEQIGYSNLVDSWLGISIDKGARFTDWARRPLDARQIEYAIGDVTHLAKIFPKMLERLRKTGRGAWLDQEMERLADPANYANDPDSAWKRVRISGRNPDAAELVRGHAGRIMGCMTSLMVTMKGLPLAYSKDMQDDKPPVFECHDLLGLSIAAMTGMVESATFRTDRMRGLAESGFATATDFADWLVRAAGLPFREAHHVTGRAVKRAEELGVRLDQLPFAEFQAIDARVDESLYDVLSVDASVASRTSFGGTAPVNVRAAIAAARETM